VAAAVAAPIAAEKRPAKTLEPRDVDEAPPYRPEPPTNKGTQTIFMDFNHSPREIVRVMDETRQQAMQFNSQRGRSRLFLFLLFPLGALFLLVDLLLGYNNLTFALVAVTLWLWAVIGLIYVGRRGKPPKFGPQFQLAETVIETLRDDVSKKRTLVGWLDLSGAERPSKKYRGKTSPSGRPVSYYRDEWLRFKARLVDGNALRLTLVEQRKVREGFWKRSRISGKQKFKPGSSTSQHQMQIGLSVAPGAYHILPFNGRNPSIPDSRFTIENMEAGYGFIKLKAVANQAFDAWDVLHALRYTYDHLQPVSA
jgi:hypothetical protein